MNTATIKQTDSFLLGRLKSAGRILVGFCACVIIASFPETVAGQSRQEEKSDSLQTSTLTQTNNYQTNVCAASKRTIGWVNAQRRAELGPPAMSQRPLFIVNNFVRVIFIVWLLLPAVILVRWPKIKSQKSK